MALVLLVSIRQGAIVSSSGVADGRAPAAGVSPLAALQSQAASALAAAPELLVRLDDLTQPTLKLARQVKDALGSGTRMLVPFHAHSSGEVAALQPSLLLVELDAAGGAAEQQLRAKANQLPNREVVLTVRDDVLAGMSPSHLASFDACASSWLVRTPGGVSALVSSGTTLRVLFAPTGESTPGACMLALDRLAAGDISRVQLLLPFNGREEADPSAKQIAQHWAALRRRHEFRQQKAQEAVALQAQLEAHSSTQHIPAPSVVDHAMVDASPRAAATGAPARPIAGPALFYRAAFSPPTMYYRLALHFSPGLSSTPALVAHGVFSEALKSFLGNVGAAKAQLQMVEWDEAKGEGILTADAAVSVGVRAAFMLIGAHQGKACRIEVKQQSQFLTALHADME